MRPGARAPYDHETRPRGGLALTISSLWSGQMSGRSGGALRVKSHFRLRHLHHTSMPLSGLGTRRLFTPQESPDRARKSTHVAVPSDLTFDPVNDNCLTLPMPCPEHE
jgi:hypothetical protein